MCFFKRAEAQAAGCIGGEHTVSSIHNRCYKVALFIVITGALLLYHLELFGKVNTDYRVTVVMVTHDVFSASFCNRIIFLKDGKFVNEIEKSGSQQDFYKAIQKEMREMDGIF